MIHHIVVFNLRDDAEWKQLSIEIEENLARLPMVRNFQMGEVIREDGPYKYMFSMDFDSAEALQEYLDVHRKFSHGRLIPAMGEWLKGLDYRLIEP